MAGLQETLLPIFIAEAEEGLALIQQLIDTWEHDVNAISTDILEDARRAAHTIKGTAGLVKRMQSSTIAKELEELLDGIKSGTSLEQTDLAVVKDLHQQIVTLLQFAHNGQPEPTGEAAIDSDPVNVEQAPTQPSSSTDLINDFALPFLLKLHQSSSSIDETIKPVCCRFFLGGRQYYIPIEDVVEITEREPITYLPYGPAYITGLMTLRGEVMPVINLAALEQRIVTLPTVYFMVIARSSTDTMAFISDQLPNINLKTAGNRIDVKQFVEQYSMKA